jgi:hypothetical protein
MRKKKTFDCVEMKWEIQKKIEQEYEGVNDNEKYKTALGKLRNNPVFKNILKKPSRIS